MSSGGLEDVLAGTVWAYRDEWGRKSRRHKDLADILRVVETHLECKGRLSPEIESQVE